MYRNIYHRIEQQHGIAACLLFLALMLSSATAVAQGSYDDMRYNRWTLARSGTGNTDKADYGIGHNGYAGEVVETNLMNFRLSFKTLLMLEEPKVEVIDSSLTKRAVEEAINIAEHKLDLAWMAERDRINKRLNLYHENVQKIGNYNGTMSAYTYFDLNEQRFRSGIKALQDSYQPNSYKKREYTALYEELLEADAALCRYLEYCRAKDKIVIPDTTSVRRPSVRQIASNAHLRWMDAMNQAATR